MSPLAAWNRFWFDEVDAVPFALTRIATAMAGLYLWVGTAPILLRYYTDEGEFSIAMARDWAPFVGAEIALPDFLGGLPSVVVLFTALLGALGCLLVGCRTTIAAVSTWLLFTWLHLRNPTFLNGGDEVVRIALFYIAVGSVAAPAKGRALSLDLIRSVGGADEVGLRSSCLMPAWPLRLLQIQVCAIYAVAGVWKLLGTSWWDGSVIYYALGNPYLTRFGIPDWPAVQPLFATLSITVAWWETLFPLLVLWRRTRLSALVFGVLVHGTIFATMNIGVFSFAMLATYSAFLPSGVAASLVHRLRDLRGMLTAGPRAVAAARSP